jgi:hypothetical protein
MTLRRTGVKLDMASMCWIGSLTSASLTASELTSLTSEGVESPLGSESGMAAASLGGGASLKMFESSSLGPILRGESVSAAEEQLEFDRWEIV